MQDIFDDLYERSKNNATKGLRLYEHIISKDNILLAFRNIKANTGSKTAGTDGITIDKYKIENVDEFIEEIYELSSEKMWISILTRLHAILARAIKPELYAEIVEFEGKISLSLGQVVRLIIDDLRTLVEMGRIDKQYAENLLGRMVQIGREFS